MKSKFVILCTLICALFISGCSKKDIRNERLQNGLYVKSAYYDFGKIDKSKNVRANFEFELANRNRHDITIKDIDVSCDCIIIENIPKVIHKDNKQIIRGYVKIKDFKGKISKPIFVNFDDNVILLRIIGTII